MARERARFATDAIPCPFKILISVTPKKRTLRAYFFLCTSRRHNHHSPPFDPKCGARDFVYQAPPVFLRALKKIGEPGDEARCSSNQEGEVLIVANV